MCIILLVKQLEKIIDGDEINLNIKRKKDVDYESNIVILVDNGFNNSKGVTVSQMSLNNKYFGELVLVKDFIKSP